MSSRTCSAAAIFLAACLAGSASTASAQGIEITPFGGYRFGGDFFELVSGGTVDTDGAPAVGAIVDVPLGYGLQFEALFTHQDAHVTSQAGPFGLPSRWRVSVDHVQGGALQEYSSGRVRPFATGLLGLTRYAGGGDSEIRFSLGAGGGVKLFPSSRFGVRLNGQVFSTFVYGNAWVSCGSYACLLKVHTDIVWQMEFSAALVVKVS
jgi:hypothetical protein